MHDGTIFALDLKAKRKAAKLTQQALADRLGIHRGHYIRIEQGERNISFPLAIECAKLFGSLRIRYQGETFVLRPDGSLSPDPDDRGPDNGERFVPPIACSDEGAVLVAEAEATEAVKALRAFRSQVAAFVQGEAGEYVARAWERLEGTRQAINLLEHRLRRRPEYAGAVAAGRASCLRRWGYERQAA